MLHADMVSFSFSCPGCHKKLRSKVAKEWIGKKVVTKCPACAKSLRLTLEFQDKVQDVNAEPPDSTSAPSPVMTRNEKRNRPIGNERACKHCNFVWPASTHLGRFESYQSRCKHGKKKCTLVSARK